MQKPLTLSIVIPVFNEAHHLKKCLDAIADQKVAPDEVIVVDNNSNDDSAKIAAGYSFVKVISEPQQGIVYARNAGFDASTSDIIGRIDADTVLPNNWTKRVRAFYSNPKHDKHALTGGGYFYNIILRRFYGFMQGQFAFRFNRFLVGHYILWGSNMAFTRQQWLDVKHNVCLRTDIHEDLDLAMHLDRIGFKISFKENLRVGVEMKRVLTHRHQLWDNLMLWPKTLRVHRKKTWVLGWLGAFCIFLYSVSPLGLLTVFISRLLQR